MNKKVLILTPLCCYVEKDYFAAEQRIKVVRKECGQCFVVLDITHATECDLVEIGCRWNCFDINDAEEIAEMYKDLVVDTSDMDEFYYWWYNK